MRVRFHISPELCTFRIKYHYIGPCSSFKAKWGFPGIAAKGNSPYSGTILKSMQRNMRFSAKRKMTRPPVAFFFPSGSVALGHRASFYCESLE